MKKIFKLIESIIGISAILYFLGNPGQKKIDEYYENIEK